MGPCLSRSKVLGHDRSRSNRGRTQNGLRPLLRDGAIDPGLQDTHEYMQPLGKGGTGEICLFRDRQTGKEVAIKLIKRPLPRMVANSLLREILIQAELGEGHVNIVEAHEVVLTEKHLCLVMEYAAGRNLTWYVGERFHKKSASGLFLTEDETRYFFKQFISAVAFCHANSVAHRDLKLDNTLLDDSRPPRIKLCDFGFAKGFDAASSNMFTNIGTPAYMAPAQLHRRSDKDGYSGTATDVWAAGVLLTVMLLGTFPFDHVDNPDPNTRDAQMEVWVQQVKTHWQDVPQIAAVADKLSPEVKDLLDRIFVLDEAERITLGEVQRHPWFLRPPAPSFSAATAQLAADQRRVDEYVRTRRISMSLKAERAARIEDLIASAGLRPPVRENPATSPEVRINLRDAAILEPSQQRTSPHASLASIPESRSAVSLASALSTLQQDEALAAMQQLAAADGNPSSAAAAAAAVPHLRHGARSSGDGAQPNSRDAAAEHSQAAGEQPATGRQRRHTAADGAEWRGGRGSIVLGAANGHANGADEEFGSAASNANGSDGSLDIGGDGGGDGSRLGEAGSGDGGGGAMPSKQAMAALAAGLPAALAADQRH